MTDHDPMMVYCGPPDSLAYEGDPLKPGVSRLRRSLVPGVHLGMFRPALSAAVRRAAVVDGQHRERPSTAPASPAKAAAAPAKRAPLFGPTGTAWRL